MARHRHRARPAAAALVAGLLALLAPPALGASPEVVEIGEPLPSAAPLNPGDVHMVASYEDADGDQHLCTDWEIRTTSPSEPVWRALCALGQERTHVHLGDGQFVNSHAGRSALLDSTSYELRVRFRDDSGIPEEEWSAVAVRPFTTKAAEPPGDPTRAWTARDGYTLEAFAENLQLPVGIAMVPDPGPHPGDPLMYVTELYGTVKVITRDGSVKDYATGLLNFDPTGHFPGSGEIGLAGIAVDPSSGDVFVSMVYQDAVWQSDPKPHYPKVVRLHSDPPGLSATGQTIVLDMAGEPQGSSHQISNLEITPAGELLINNGDGGDAATARDLESFRGKVLRTDLDGTPLQGNPYFDHGDGITARDYVYASGFRNPFGGAWRISDSGYFVVENGPVTDRLARLYAGADYLWAGSDATMTFGASYNWHPSHAPVGIDFVEEGRFGGSGFPDEAMGSAFVTESGPTYTSGPQVQGKRVVEFSLQPRGGLREGPTTLVEYTGTGKATAAGIAAGPGGVYFSELYRDADYVTPIDRGARILRVAYCGSSCPGDRPPEVDTVAPQITSFRLQRSVIAVPERRRAARRSRAHFGTAFLYSLSEPASTTIRIRPAMLGWRLKGKCRRRPAPRKRQKRCPLPARGGKRGLLKAPGDAGANRRFFAGRVNGGWLTPGRYRATIAARDGGGNVSQARTAYFRVVRGP